MDGMKVLPIPLIDSLIGHVSASEPIIVSKGILCADWLK